MSEQQETLEALRRAVAQIQAGAAEGGLFQDGQTGESPTGESPSSGGSGSGSGSSGADSAGSESSGSQNSGSESDDSRSDYEKARAVVLRKLTGSAKSRHQLAESLREREFEESVITAVLDRMEEVHLLDDADFARTWVRTRHEMKNLGRAALRRELKEKGIEEALAEEALEQIGAEDEDAAARELVAKKLRGTTIPVGNGPEERKEREKHTRRLVSMLARRGHSPGAAFQIVREALDEQAAHQ